MRTSRESAPKLRKTMLGLLLAVALVTVASGFSGFPPESPGPPQSAKPSKDDDAAKAAFLAAYPVFLHPRCMNCHPVAAVPLQGEDSRPHAQNVQRAPAGRGKYALKCTNCHQTENTPGANMPPGAPNWHMPPARMKMVFQGKSAGELCRQFKDPKQNGGHTVAGAIEHLEKDPLVLWGWSPGEGRGTPPLSHADFLQKMQTWLRNGAACPE
jgi:cytochrome c5